MQKCLGIEGMMCEHCAAAVKKALGGIHGVTGVTVDLKAKQATVDVEASVTDDALKEAVTKAGYTVVSIS